MLLALTTGQRCQTFHRLDLSNLARGTDYKFGFSTPLKQSRPGVTPVVTLKPYPPDRRLCVITTLKEYLKRTEHKRGTETKLLISCIKPHRGVSRDTVSRWIKICLFRSGIDILQYSPHSTRMASTSKACANAVPLRAIMQSAGWSNVATFKKFYFRDTGKQFHEGVLESSR